MEIIEKILRFAWAFIDSGIVWVIRTVYNLFYNLSDLMLYSEKIVESLGQRIGLILGIFMLFRLAVSLVTYLISPEKLTDNAKGGKKLLANIFISLFLLATVNILFVQAYKIQDIVIRSGFIEKIFFGAKVDPEDKQQLDISYYLYTPLFSPNEAVFGDVCKDLWDPSEKIDMKDQGACDAKLYELLGDDRRAVYRAFNSQDMRYVLSNYNVVTAKQNGEFAFDYKIVAPVIGVICALVLINFCMDLATRAIKLLFLQIIAPIPIISNIDPGKGQDIFKKWYQECLKTYVSVFLRVITINFAVYIITVILTEFDQKNAFASDPMITVALIIGALIFAKQVPKLIENIFGIKTDGAFTLNPIKKFQDQALFGKNIIGLGAAGLAGGAAMGANAAKRISGIPGGLKDTYNAFKTQGFKEGMKSVGKDVGNLFYGVGSVAAGGISAASRGVVGSVKGQKFSDVYKNSYGGAIKARNNRDDRIHAGINSFDIMSDQITHAVGMPTEAEKQDSDIKTFDEFVSSGKAAVSISESEIDKMENRIQLDKFTSSRAYKAQYAGWSLSQLREAMTNMSYTDAQRAQFKADYNTMRGDIAAKYRERATAQNAADALDGVNSEFKDFSGANIYTPATDTAVLTVKAHVENAQDIFNNNKTNDVFVKNGITNINGATIKDATKRVEYESTAIKNSGEYRRAHKIQQQAQKEGKK